MDRPATNRSVNSVARNPFDSRPFPIAFGRPRRRTAHRDRQPQARRYRRRQCAVTRTVTCQFSSSVTSDRCPAP